MSTDEQGGAGRREVAYRVFAAEYDDADLSYSESDEERAPNYVVLPTGARVNRLFAVGVLTETEPASEEVLRARVVDPTGAFVVYAGQYQPDALTFLERAEPPMFVALAGKARTFRPDDSDVTYTSVRPESVNEVDAGTRDRWTIGAARQTLDRVGTAARALEYPERGDELRARLESEGVDVGLAAGISVAFDHYGTTATYLDGVRTLAIQAAAVVAGERDEVDPLDVRPDEEGDVDPAALVTDLESGPTGTAGRATGAAGTDERGDVTAIEEDAAVSGAGAGETARNTDAAGTATDGRSGTETAEEATAGESTADGTRVESTADESAGETSTTGEPTGEPSTADEPAGERTVSGDSTADASEDTGVGDSTADASEDTGVGDSTADASEDTGVDETVADRTSADASAGTTAGESVGDTSSARGGVDEGTPASTEGPDDGALEDFEPGEFELDEEEREAVEQEYGTDFQSGTEVDAPGEAGIDTPDPDPETDESAAAGGASRVEADADAGAVTDTGADDQADAGGDVDDQADTEPAVDDQADTEPATDLDVEDAVMEAMRTHDEGTGATEEAIVEAVVSAYGVDETAVADAIEDALMDGRCYEPEDGVYKPI